ncbi:unnamed protein product [Arabidopsis thaliana]|uniref:(thale cress) hypothetical protein n=1 Tax=Arabidopsis thaliana TaxID=3702 RepID=A0A7G2F874_ARATH|nr:unnamed protein product [Arabidopsis thaliana]
MRIESLLQHDVVERILERLAVNSLPRFKAVSKQWKSTIESQFFQGKHLTHRQQSGDPVVLMPVWLYNSTEIGIEETATTCEVFDFSTNAWRYVTPAAPYRVVDFLGPLFVDGSLHWFTECQETKVISFDLHTEAYQVISKAPFLNSDPQEIVMCNLDNRLCVSEMKWPTQVIWSFNSGRHGTKYILYIW